MVKQRRRLSRTLLRLTTDNESALARKVGQLFSLSPPIPTPLCRFSDPLLHSQAFNTLSDLALLFPPALNAPGWCNGRPCLCLLCISRLQPESCSTGHRTKLALLAFTLDEGSQETMFRVVDSTILQSDELEDVDGDWSTAPFEERAKLLGMKEAHDGKQRKG